MRIEQKNASGIPSIRNPKSAFRNSKILLPKQVVICRLCFAYNSLSDTGRAFLQASMERKSAPE
jgi:hypothetical protein